MHWTKNCQHKHPQNTNTVETSEEEKDSECEVEDVNFVLTTTQNPRKRKDFVDEMITKAVIDTTCTKTVAGELWLQNYMKNLEDTSLNQVEISESRRVFKFCDSRKVIATSKAKLPAQIGNTKCFIKVEIVQEKIPLLLSKTLLKKAGTVLNLQNDNIKLFNKDMEVITSSYRHYAINILSNETCNFDNIEQVLIFEEDESDKSKIQKLHNNY